MNKNNGKRMKDLKTSIEDVYESYNGVIQIILVLAAVIVTSLYGVAYTQAQGIIITLLSLICVELLSLSLKDSIQQRKLNRIEKIVKIKAGKLLRVGEAKVDKFFRKTKDVFFVSGIALSWFFSTYINNIIQLLREGKKVCVMFCHYENFSDQEKLYFGNREDIKKGDVSKIARLQYCALNEMVSIENIENYIKEGKLEIRFSDTTFSTSFVAYDIWNGNNQTPLTSKMRSEIKISFYLYDIENASKRNPNVLVDNKNGTEWYELFHKSLLKQWKDAKRIESLDELNNIKEEVRKLM